MPHPNVPNIRIDAEKAKGMSKHEFAKFGLDENERSFVRIDDDDIGVTKEIAYIQSGPAAGRVASIRRYLTAHTVNDKAKVQTFYYEDPLYPTKPTKIVTTLETI